MLVPSLARTTHHERAFAERPIRPHVPGSRVRPSGTRHGMLGGIPANCAVERANPRTVAVANHGVTAVALTVRCVATTAIIEINTATSGIDADPDGYRIAIDGLEMLRQMSTDAPLRFVAIS